ncbi:beta-lactamase class D [Aminobacter aminovorans]|nr:class D beta-lactamase [Aminobacter aminovorans]MDR7224983.1 beta-lactamase class D [Aminobacter aminovorans]
MLASFRRSSIFAVFSFLAAAPFAQAQAAANDPALKPVFECTLIVDAQSGATLRRDGTCDRRVSPASTFKVPLALMGYDAGILADAHTPRWDYKPEFNAIKRDHRPVDPTIWEKDSVVWYSQQITRKLGNERFAGYVENFTYGNGDITGNPGKKDGLTHSWLSSSLQISPDEQAAFIKRILDHKLPLSAKAYEMTGAILPAFDAGDWKVQGKTGTGWLTNKAGAQNRNRPFGWFVGWGEKDGRKIVFARLFVNEGKSPVLLGPKVRANLLADLPGLMKPTN